MLPKPDQDGRYPLSMREYDALRTLYAATAGFRADPLKERCEKLIPGAWERLVALYEEGNWLNSQILNTVPGKKLLALKRELQYTECRVEVKRPSGDGAKDSVYVSRDAFRGLIDRAIQLECLLCDKKISESKHCPLYQSINACFPYELDEPTDQHCPFAGVSKLEVSDE